MELRAGRGSTGRPVQPWPCAGCDGLTLDGKFCNRCREEIEALDRIFAVKAAKVRAAAADYAARSKPRARSLEEFAYMAASCAAVVLLAWLTRAWWFALLDLWVGMGGW